MRFEIFEMTIGYRQFMMKKGLLFAIMAAALTFVWGCGSDDDDEITPSPTPTPGTETSWHKEATAVLPTSIDWSGNDGTPDWAAPSNAPDPANYESWMILMVTLQDELASYATANDYMGVFIGNSLRCVERPAIKIGETKDVSFILKVLGNESSDKNVDITLKYYCANLKQTFTVSGSERFVPERVYGVTETLILPLLRGCPKYPILTSVTINFPEEAPSFVTPAAEDKFLVIVNGECRGVAVLDELAFHAPCTLTAYGKADGEEGKIYYYDSSENAFWDTGKSLKLGNGSQTIDMTY